MIKTSHAKAELRHAYLCLPELHLLHGYLQALNLLLDNNYSKISLPKNGLLSLVSHISQRCGLFLQTPGNSVIHNCTLGKFYKNVIIRMALYADNFCPTFPLNLPCCLETIFPGPAGHSSLAAQCPCINFKKLCCIEIIS